MNFSFSWHDIGDNTHLRILKIAENAQFGSFKFGGKNDAISYLFLTTLKGLTYFVPRGYPAALHDIAIAKAVWQLIEAKCTEQVGVLLDKGNFSLDQWWTRVHVADAFAKPIPMIRDPTTISQTEFNNQLGLSRGKIERRFGFLGTRYHLFSSANLFQCKPASTQVKYEQINEAVFELPPTRSISELTMLERLKMVTPIQGIFLLILFFFLEYETNFSFSKMKELHDQFLQLEMAMDNCENIAHQRRWTKVLDQNGQETSQTFTQLDVFKLIKAGANFLCFTTKKKTHSNTKILNNTQ